MSEITIDLISSYINNLHSNDIEQRKKSISHLEEISYFIGPDKTMHQLIPFLIELVDDEDEILILLSQVLLSLLPCFNSKEYGYVMIDILEKLVIVENIDVINHTIKCIENLINKSSPEIIQKHFIPFYKRLFSGKWVNNKLAACKLTTSLYKKANEEHQYAIIDIYSVLSKDESPIVRKECCIIFKNLIKLIDDKIINEKNLMNIYNDFIHDEQDRIKIEGINSMEILAEHFKDSDKEKLIIDHFAECIRHNSWTIRYAICKIITRIYNILKNSIVYTLISQKYIYFLQDSEEKVRQIAINNIHEYAKIINKNTLIATLEVLFNFMDNETKNNKLAISSQILKLSNYLSISDFKQYALKPLKILLEDNYYDIGLIIIKSVGDNDKISLIESKYKIFIPSFIQYSNSENWRQRLTIIEFTVDFIKKIGIKNFNEDFFKVCVSWLFDNAYTIRKVASKNIVKLSEIMGEEWSIRYILKEILKMTDNKNYLYRIIIIDTLSEIIGILNVETTKKEILPYFEKFSKDDIKNVRYTFVKLCDNIIRILPNEIIINEVMPLLKELTNDSYEEVKMKAKRLYYK